MYSFSAFLGWLTIMVSDMCLIYLVLLKNKAKSNFSSILSDVISSSLLFCLPLLMQDLNRKDYLSKNSSIMCLKVNLVSVTLTFFTFANLLEIPEEFNSSHWSLGWRNRSNLSFSSKTNNRLKESSYMANCDNLKKKKPQRRVRMFWIPPTSPSKSMKLYSFRECITITVSINN